MVFLFSLFLQDQMELRELPCAFIGDEAFSLCNNFLKPFLTRLLNYKWQIFNYRLSWAWSTVENAFGILSARFHIFQSAINLNLHNTDTVVLACCILHNYLMKKSKNSYYHDQPDDNSDLCNLASLQVGNNWNHKETGKDSWEKYIAYFINEIHVDWQHRIINQN